MLLCRMIVSGRVQNVGFRVFVKELADSMTLTGEVKNNYDSSVEIKVYASKKEEINDFIEKVKVGPEYASISNINIVMTASDPYYKNEFVILP